MEEEKRFIWGRKPCKVYNSFIRPIHKEEAWDLYEPFNLNTGENEKSLYLKFAALTTEEEIVKFVSEYGFLGIFKWGHISNNILGKGEAKHIYEKVEDIQKEARRMLLLAMIWEGLNPANENVDELENAIRELEAIRKSEDEKFKGFFIFQRENENAYLEWIYSFRIAARTIGMEVNRQLDGLSYEIEWSWEDNRFISHLLPDSLLTALYVMFQQDLTRGVKLRKCKNETCKEHFAIYGNDERKIYCDITCKSQQVQREYRRRIKNREREE